MRFPPVLAFAVLAAAISALLPGNPADAQETGRARLVIADIDYLDTSGEPGDQEKAHENRVQLFEDVLGDALTGEGDYALAEMACGRETCGTGTMTLAEIVAAARGAGADYVLVGAIQKVSTLIGSGRVDLIDVENESVVVARVLSFRGDNDEAFRRAAVFAARSILAGFSPAPDAAAR